MSRIIDLSQEIYEGMPVYAGHLETKVWQHHRHEDTAPNFDSGFSYQSLGLHAVRSRAHACRRDQPSRHRAGRAHESMRCRSTRSGGRGSRLDISPLRAGEYCTAERLDQALAQSDVELRPGDVLLLRTGAADRNEGRPEYTTEYGGLDQSAADWLRDHQPKIFGVDSPSPDTPGDRIYPVHLYCRAAWRHALREPDQPRRRPEPALHVLRLPAPRPGRARIAGPSVGDGR